MNCSNRLFGRVLSLARRAVLGLVFISLLTSSLAVTAQERPVRIDVRNASAQRSVRYGNPVGYLVPSGSKCSIGVKEVHWTSRNGASYNALAYYPTTPPRDGVGFPAVIFSHGLGSSAENFAYLARSWASEGIVVLCLRHPGSDESIWRGKLRAMNELREAYQKYWTARDRATAISSAVDFLYASHNNSGPMGADVDLERIGVVGNDLGALGALLVAGQLPPDNGVSLKDPRVAAVLALSPPVFCESSQGVVVYESIQVPLMILTGTEDDGIVGKTKAYQRRIPYDSVRWNDRFLVVLQGGDHRVYAGHKMASKQAHDAPYQETIRVVSTEFWRAYLRADALALSGMRSGSFATKFSNASVEAKCVEAPAAVVDTDAAAVQISDSLGAAPQVGKPKRER